MQAALAQVTRFGNEPFHCDRRACVLLRDCLRFGTAIVVSLCCGSSDPWVYFVSSDCQPLRLDHRSSVPSS